MGRPRIFMDFATVLRLRDVENLGWSRMADVYRQITGRYVSRDTMKRWYLQAKARHKGHPPTDCVDAMKKDDSGDGCGLSGPRHSPWEEDSRSQCSLFVGPVLNGSGVSESHPFSNPRLGLAR